MNSIMDIIYIPFGYLVRFFDKLCGGQYILTLLLFSIAVKILMLPFSIKQQKNQIKGAKLRPKMALIEKKYGKAVKFDVINKEVGDALYNYIKEGMNYFINGSNKFLSFTSGILVKTSLKDTELVM